VKLCIDMKLKNEGTSRERVPGKFLNPRCARKNSVTEVALPGSSSLSVGCSETQSSKVSGTTNQFRQRAKLSKSPPPHRLRSMIRGLLIAARENQPAMSAAAQAARLIPGYQQAATGSRPPKPNGGDDQSEHILKDSALGESIRGQLFREGGFSGLYPVETARNQFSPRTSRNPPRSPQRAALLKEFGGPAYSPSPHTY